MNKPRAIVIAHPLMSDLIPEGQPWWSLHGGSFVRSLDYFSALRVTPLVESGIDHIEEERKAESLFACLHQLKFLSLFY